MKSSKHHKARRGHKRGTRNTAKSSLGGPSTDSKVWNITAQQMPAFNNTQKKDNSIHRFIQTTDLNTVFTSSVSTATPYARSFTFNDVNQASSFQAIFDQYRITEIEVWLTPGLNPSSTAFGVGSMIVSVIDYDDDSTPSTGGGYTALQQYTNAIVTTPINGHYRKWQPHVAESLYSGAFTSFGNIRAPWIDMASPGVKHYGFKCVVTVANQTAAIQSYDLTMRLHFECRNVF